MIFSVLGCYPQIVFYLLLPFQEGSGGSGTCFTLHSHGCLLGSRSHWPRTSCETLHLPPSPYTARTRLCHVQNSGVSWERLPSVGRHGDNLSMLPFSWLGKAGNWGTVDPGFSSPGVNMMAGGAGLKDLGRGSRGVCRTWASWSAQGVAVVTRRVREWLLGWGQLSLGMSSPRVLGPGSKSRLQAQLAPPQPPCMAPCAARTSEQLAGLARGTAPLRSGSGAKRPASSDWDVSSVGPWGEQRSVSAGWPRHSGRVCARSGHLGTQRGHWSHTVAQ